MRNLLLIFTTTILLTNCNNKQVDSQAITNVVDSISNDSALARTERFFNNPFRDINNFDIEVGNDFIDSLNSSLQNRQDIETTINKDICIGDNCESYKTIFIKPTNTVFYFFKGDGGEYGFSNDQYLLNADTISFVRNFNVNIDTWPTDSTKTVWKIEELTYMFYLDKVVCAKRTALTEDLEKFDLTLKNINSEIVKLEFDKAYQDKSEELKKMLSAKDSELRD